MGGDGDLGGDCGGGADGAGNDIFIRVGGARFFAGFEPFSEEGMVLGEEFELLVAEAVDAAVADVGVDDGFFGPDKTAEGGAHALERVVFLTEAVDPLVGFFNGVAEFDHPFKGIGEGGIFDGV